MTDKPTLPAYHMTILRNRHGASIVRMEFTSQYDLEIFITHELIGTGMLIGSDHEVIGCTLLIWDHN